MHTRLGRGMKVAQNVTAVHHAPLTTRKGEWDKQEIPVDP